MWFKNRRAKFRTQQKSSEEKAEAEKPSEKPEKISDPVSGQLSPISANSADSSNSSGYSTELSVNQSKSTEESNEKLIEEALNSPKIATAPELGPLKIVEPAEPAVQSGFENFEKFRESFDIPTSESPEMVQLDRSGSDSVSGTSEVSAKIQTSSPVLAGSDQMKTEIKEEKNAEPEKTTTSPVTEVNLKFLC